jgi:hypothetical protein
MKRRRIHPAKSLKLAVTPELVLRFMSFVKIDPEKGCWVWRGYLDKQGYGQFFTRGQARGAHRVSYAIFRCSIPDGREIDHRKNCRNHACVNPAHLRKTTISVNRSDGAKYREQKKRELEPIPF